VKNLKACFLLILVTLFVSALSSFAEEWTPEQETVWKTVQEYNGYFLKGDFEKYISYCDPDYLGWNYQYDIPWDKSTFAEWSKYYFETTKIVQWNIMPVGIKIHDNVAFVHYYFSGIEKDKDGKEKVLSGRFTDILMKEGNKWLIIGDHGGELSNSAK